MMVVHVKQKSLFTYGIDLDTRVRKDRPLRRGDNASGSENIAHGRHAHFVAHIR